MKAGAGVKAGAAAAGAGVKAAAAGAGSAAAATGTLSRKCVGSFLSCCAARVYRGAVGVEGWGRGASVGTGFVRGCSDGDDGQGL